VTRIVWLACEYGRYGYRRITALLQCDGWRVNHKRVERIWRDEGLKMPTKQPKRRRLCFNDGSCIRLRPTHRNHAWSYGLFADRTSDGRNLESDVIHGGRSEYKPRIPLTHLGRGCDISIRPIC
jgi:transposase InsO family protein